MKLFSSPQLPTPTTDVFEASMPLAVVPSRVHFKDYNTRRSSERRNHEMVMEDW